MPRSGVGPKKPRCSPLSGELEAVLDARYRHRPKRPSPNCRRRALHSRRPLRSGAFWDLSAVLAVFRTASVRRAPCDPSRAGLRSL